MILCNLLVMAIMQLIGYDIYMSNSTNNINIMYWYNQTIYNIPIVEFYIMAHKFDVQKQYWKRYQIVYIKSNQHQH